jgi:putative ABC transport system permease protein
VATVLKGFAGLVVAVAGVSLFAALSYVLSARMLDVAVIRALGARRRDVMQLLTLETATIAFLGVALGVLLARAVAYLSNRWLPAQAQLSVSAPTINELIICGGVIAFALLCTLWPAWRAYRADAAHILAKGSL